MYPNTNTSMARAAVILPYNMVIMSTICTTDNSITKRQTAKSKRMCFQSMKPTPAVAASRVHTPTGMCMDQIVATRRFNTATILTTLSTGDSTTPTATIATTTDRCRLLIRGPSI